MENEAVWAVLTLVALCLLFYGPWQDVCTDYARQVMFEKRDALFDMGVRGEIDLGSPQYRTIRSSLEKGIRFAHELTLPRFLLFRWNLRRTNLKRSESALFDAIAMIENPETRRNVTRLVGEAQLALILMAMAKSPLTVVISIVGALLIKFRNGFKKWIREAVQPLAEMVQIEAEYAPSSVSDSYVS
ncbi:hypothetical protein [Oricola cellulosilytica]|uniref:Uncharacterized protein n=1 Tax=Oricola cellulosilytica TaxID=1429082 RepID=A0A4R0PAN3_9HYPH|nr:hypothetical protein [Oricola cellulosilytica]TCD14096.1 hypothetical protein E0D97_08355 [Oricola cellulosilytica]